MLDLMRGRPLEGLREAGLTEEPRGDAGRDQQAPCRVRTAGLRGAGICCLLGPLLSLMAATVCVCVCVCVLDVVYVYAQCSGIFLTSTVYFIIYCSVKRNRPHVLPSLVLPGTLNLTLNLRRPALPRPTRYP